MISTADKRQGPHLLPQLVRFTPGGELGFPDKVLLDNLLDLLVGDPKVEDLLACGNGKTSVRTCT